MQLLEESQKIINHPDWTFKKNTSENDTLHILNLPKIGKLFKISVSIFIDNNDFFLSCDASFNRSTNN